MQIAKAAGIDYRVSLDLLKKTQSEPFLNRWETRFDLSEPELRFASGSNLYDKDVPLAAEVGRALGAEIPITEEMAKLGVRLSGGKCST